MATSKAKAHWEGKLGEGEGTIGLGSGAFEGPYDFKSRTGAGATTTPEELLGASHAGCFAMALTMILGEAGHVADSIDVAAEVELGKDAQGFAIKRIKLDLVARIPDITTDEFEMLANQAFANCPISRALDVSKELDATLEA